MNVQPYNFNKPGRLAGDLGQRLADWLQAACALASKKCSGLMPFAFELSFVELDIFRCKDALQKLPEAATGYRINVVEESLALLASFPRPLALALVAGAEGEQVTSLPEDRPLTAVDKSLLELLVRELLIEVLQETWPSPEEVRLELGQYEPYPKWTRLFPPDENVVVCSLTFSGPFGQQNWHLLLPHQGSLEKLSRLGPGQEEATEELAARPRLEALVRDIPVEITVWLGTLELPLSQLAELRAGDVLVLNQRVTEALTAWIGRVRKFRGWPGRVGSHMAFQIESPVES